MMHLFFQALKGPTVSSRAVLLLVLELHVHFSQALPSQPSAAALSSVEKNVRAYQFTNVTVQGPFHDEIKVTFFAYDQLFELFLRRAVKKKVHVIIVSEHGQRSMDMQPSYYSGTVGRDVGSYAHGTLDDDGVFSGSIFKDKWKKNATDTFYVEPLCDFDRTEKCSNTQSVVYRRKDIAVGNDLKKAMRYKSTTSKRNKAKLERYVVLLIPGVKF